MNPIKILVVDDEAEIRRFLEVSLTGNGYSVTMAETGKMALQLASAKVPDLIILDLGLPDTDGKTIIQQLREWSSVPIIVLSARDQEAEKVEAFENGADDYLTKPFGTAELLARIKVALRHMNNVKAKTGNNYDSLGLSVNLDERRVILNQLELKLTPTEYKLLAALVKQAGKVVTQNHLINEVWGKNSQGNSHYLRIYIQHLRSKLQDDPLKPHFIMTEAGIGYRLAESNL